MVGNGAESRQAPAGILLHLPLHKVKLKHRGQKFTAVPNKRIEYTYKASCYLFSTLCDYPPFANHLRILQPTNK